MEKKAILLECTGETHISRQRTPEFYRCYLQVMLLALKQQGDLSEEHYQFCMAELTGDAGQRKENEKEAEAKGESSSVLSCFYR